MALDFAQQPKQFALFRIIPEPSRKGVWSRGRTVHVIRGGYTGEYCVRGHQRPLLLRAVDHGVDEVAVGD
jgi:hypothetical protein